MMTGKEMAENLIYKYELHLHTKEASACAVSTAVEMVDYYKANGFAGFVVTDHFFGGNTAVSFELPWEERVTQFCKGYYRAKERGDHVGFSVFFGLEYNFYGTEFLFFGLEPDWIKAHPEIMQRNLIHVLKMVKGVGGFVVHAHPFREESYIDMIRLVPEQTDAVEVFNAGNLFRNPIYNKRALIFAMEYNLPITSGSDIHSTTSTIEGGITCAHKLSHVEELIAAIANRQCGIIWEQEHIHPSDIQRLNEDKVILR